MAGEGEEEGVGGAKKWSMDEDKRLINAWINTSSDPIVGAGADQQRKGFWRRVADHFNEHVPHGDSRRTWKTCNSRWNRCAPLVSKWAGIVEETVHLEQSGMSMEDVMPRAHELFVQRTGRTFELDYWWRLLRDQPKWKESYCNDESVGALKCAKVNELGGHSDTSIPGIEDPAAEEGGGLIRRIGRKAAKRKAKEKAAANTIVNLVTNQLSTMGATAVEKVDVFRQYVKVEERKVVLFEEAVRLRERQQAFKERQWEEKVRRMKIADMRSEDAACYGQLQEEIRSKYRQQLPSNEWLTMDASSSSSSSSSDGLSFILEESRDDMPILEEFLDDETDTQQMLLLLQLRQAAERMGASSSIRPRRKKRFIRRNREKVHDRLHKDYFAEDSVYNENHFRRRFRMRKHLFVRIMEALGNYSAYFQLRYDGLGRQGLTPLTKCTAAMRMLAYNMSADCVDEYLKIGESTATECMKKFAAGVVAVFGEEYLRKPTQVDIDRLLAMGNARDFPGMLGSIDCMHWEWKNCPIAWKSMFAKGRYKVPTLILEATVSYDLWIWHALFGCPGSLNDIHLFDRSSVFYELYQDQVSKCEYVINSHKYTIGYFLSDGIYPKWATFVKTIPLPQGPKEKLFAQRQEALRKDVAQAFDVLQARFGIIRGSSRLMDEDEMGLIMKACVILHNMIIEDERDSFDLALDYEHVEASSPMLNIRHDHHPCYATYFNSRSVEVQDPETHGRLRADLVEEIWNRNLERKKHE